MQEIVQAVTASKKVFKIKTPLEVLSIIKIRKNSTLLIMREVHKFIHFYYMQLCFLCTLSKTEIDSRSRQLLLPAFSSLCNISRYPFDLPLSDQKDLTDLGIF
jgi:hypothetical protein